MALLKGEVPFTADGQDYTLLLDFNALCDLESELPGLMDGEAQIQSPSAVRAVFHAGLQTHHEGVSLKEAGRIIHAVGLEDAARLIAVAFDASFPSTKGGEEASRPRKAPAKAGAGKGR